MVHNARPIQPQEREMAHERQFYIDGAWTAPTELRLLDVVDPATEEPYTQIAVGSAADVDRAVAAARRAFPTYSATSRAERLALLRAVLAEYRRRTEDMAQAISHDMGAPVDFARASQATAGEGHLERIVEVLETYAFEWMQGPTRIVREPIGVCGLITPWNWPINQIVCKVGPALAAGCTMVLKPSEVAPMSGVVFAEILDAAGVPAGVFNLVHGDGPTVGAAISSHPDIDFVSFTGSTRAGIEVARNAAPTVKRVAQELGGKSPNILLPDADFRRAVRDGLARVMRNSGQSCNAPTRMFVPADRHDEVKGLAKAAVEAWSVGDPRQPGSHIGPVVSRVQFEKIQRLIQSGIDEGAELVAGGPGRPEGFNRGYYVRPTVFGNVNNDMTIAREEIFGPVLSILPYRSEEEAIRLANDTPYGLAGYVQSTDMGHARRVASALRAGQVFINEPGWDTAAPFGGYKQSGNGREYGRWALDEFTEVKAVLGYEAA
jgi:aldehyde dehydrogenase (NAD+)